MDLNTNNTSSSHNINNNTTCNGIRSNFSRANSVANILESGPENVIRDIHPTIKITNLTSSSGPSSANTAAKILANGHLRRSYLSVNLDDANDVVWKRKSEVNLNNKDDNEGFVHHHIHRQAQQQEQNHPKKNVYNSSVQSFNDFSNDHFMAVSNSTRRKCINMKAQTENNYLVWVTPVAAR